MIDPQNITRYDRNDEELQELLIFCIAVFNKPADQIKYKVEDFLNWCKKHSRAKDHFARIRSLEKRYHDDGLSLVNEYTHHPGAKWLVNKFRFGNTTQKSNGIHGVVNAKGLDLRTCSEQDLEQFSGISMKTSRFFILHTRADANVACLDTHILHWLRDYTGLEWIPVKPPSVKKYLLAEKLFLDIASENEITPAELDLTIWNKQRGSDDQQVVGKRQIKKELSQRLKKRYLAV